MDGVGEKKRTKLGCEKDFCRATYILSTTSTADALS